MTEKKYLWLDGTIHETLDPDWTEEKAVKQGLIPARDNKFSSVSVFSEQNSSLIHQVMMNSLGSFAWDRPGLENR